MKTTTLYTEYELVTFSLNQIYKAMSKLKHHLGIGSGKTDANSAVSSVSTLAFPGQL